MRRTVGAITFAFLIGLGVAAMPAGPAGAGRIRSVEFSGTSVFEFTTTGCLVHQVFDATLTTRRGDVVHIEGCPERLATPTPFAGTFTIDAPGRRETTGTVSGVVGGGEPTAPCPGDLIAVRLDFELAPARVSRRPHDPLPPLQLDGTWCSPVAAGVPGPISGTLTGALPPVGG